MTSRKTIKSAVISFIILSSFAAWALAPNPCYAMHHGNCYLPQIQQTIFQTHFFKNVGSTAPLFHYHLHKCVGFNSPSALASRFRAERRGYTANINASSETSDSFARLWAGSQYLKGPAFKFPPIFLQSVAFLF